VRGIDVLLGKLATITTTADAVDHLSGMKLASCKGVFGWYLHHDQLEKARISPDTPWRTWLTGQ
jgi:hypothetical protein